MKAPLRFVSVETECRPSLGAEKPRVLAQEDQFAIAITGDQTHRTKRHLERTWEPCCPRSGIIRAFARLAASVQTPEPAYAGHLPSALLNNETWTAVG